MEHLGPVFVPFGRPLCVFRRDDPADERVGGASSGCGPFPGLVGLSKNG